MVSNAIDMELENTVCLITPVQFSVVRIIILFIQFSNTVQNTWLHGPAQILVNFAKSQNCKIPEGLWKG